MGKFIGQTGLVYLWSKVKTWVGNYVKITEVNGVKSITVGNITATLATKTSQLTNDSGFITSADVPEGAAASTTTPKMDGTAAVGSETAFARGDHRHPTDTSRQAVIEDLDAIRSGAALGATALQSFTESDPTVPAWAKASSKPTYTKTEVGLGNVTNDAQVKRTEMGAANGVATLGSDGKVPSSQLPSYVDDVVEAYIRSGQTALSSTWLATGSASGTVITPESGVIYMIMNGNDTYPTNSEYRWGGSAYVPIYDGGATELTTAEMDTATNNWS